LPKKKKIHFDLYSRCPLGLVLRILGSSIFSSPFYFILFYFILFF
jgi:hypothetical protein